MNQPNRFQDENLLLSHFYNEVLIICPSCGKKATAKVDFETKKARSFCMNCGYNKEVATTLSQNASLQMPAHSFFNAGLWLQTSFKNEIFYAYNDGHLDYLERYISATLREHKDRIGFTLIEKLPKFYHEAKNRESLLKIIEKLKNK